MPSGIVRFVPSLMRNESTPCPSWVLGTPLPAPHSLPPSLPTHRFLFTGLMDPAGFNLPIPTGPWTPEVITPLVLVRIELSSLLRSSLSLPF